MMVVVVVRRMILTTRQCLTSALTCRKRDPKMVIRMMVMGTFSTIIMMIAIATPLRCDTAIAMVAKEMMVMMMVVMVMMVMTP